MNLRDYQEKSINEVWSYLCSGKGLRPLIVAPTGSGKSILIAELVRRIIKSKSDAKIVMLTHVKELVKQNYEKLQLIAPDLDAGIYSAGLKRKELRQITFASIQSIYKRSSDLGKINVILIDECHLVPRAGSGRYRSFLKAAESANPKLVVIGLSATPFRLGSGYLHTGKGALFDGIASEISIPELISAGYLSAVRPKAGSFQIDVSGVKKRGGEYIESELAKAADTDENNRAAVADIISKGADRKAWLIFCVNIEHVEHINALLQAKGIQSGCVHGQLSNAERDQILADFKAGKLQAVTNCNILTTGFDYPEIDLIAFLRPTESTALYIQMVGRGMRIAPGKESCLVLDYAGNVMRHGCIDDPDIATPNDNKKNNAAPVKSCPNCLALVHAAHRECPDCGHIFERPEPKPDRQAAALELISSYRKPQKVRVDWVEYAIHTKKATGSKSLKITYCAGDPLFPQKLATLYLAIESEKARYHAQKWWRRHAISLSQLPETTEEALKHIKAHGAVVPSHITITNDKYPQILGYHYESKSAATN